MWIRQILLAVIGSSAGAVAAGGLFAFIAELGVISDFADRTHTGDKIQWYETCVMSDTASWRCDTAGGGGDVFRDVCRLLGNGAGRDPESVPGIYAAF